MSFGFANGLKLPRAIVVTQDRMCPPTVYCCPECDGEIDSNEIPVLAWPRNASVFQIENRLILKVASEATSKIALDRPGAEMLLGRGHMAAKLNGEQGLVFSQAPFLSDHEIELAVKAIAADNLA